MRGRAERWRREMQREQQEKGGEKVAEKKENIISQQHKAKREGKLPCWL